MTLSDKILFNNGEMKKVFKVINDELKNFSKEEQKEILKEIFNDN